MLACHHEVIPKYPVVSRWRRDLFLLFAFIFAFPLGNLPAWYGIIFIIILTGVLHKGTNIAAYIMKLKNVPW